MQRTLSNEVQNLIERRLATGRYSSEDELLKLALLSLDDYDECVAAIQAGMDDEAAGRIISLQDSVDEIRRELGLTS